MVSVLRPAPPEAIMPYDLERVIGLRAQQDIPSGHELRWTVLGE